MALDFESLTTISFDCYGTLIDWEGGISAALQPVLVTRGIAIDREQLLADYAQIESAIESEEYRSYREVLREVLSRFGAKFDFAPTPDELETCADSPTRWPPFPDSGAALRKLQERFRLIVLSNIDDDLFAASERALGVEFDDIITAQQVGAYKPSPAMFAALLARCSCQPERLLHAAQSLYHDIAPAREFGLSTVWVNRRHDQTGGGATPAADAAVKPDLEVKSLAELAQLVAGTEH
ncbi:MAG: haloacid dehalogenase type II [bacterium]